MNGHKAGMEAKLEQKRMQKQSLERWTKRERAPETDAPAPKQPADQPAPVTPSQSNPEVDLV